MHTNSPNARPRLSLPIKTPEQIQKDLSKRRANGRPMKPKVKAWSHQDELIALIGKPIVLNLANGVTSGGFLENADQFTIQISSASDRQSKLTYFKSVIQSFRAASENEIG